MDNSPISIAFYLQEGVEILDFAAPLEVFFHAGYRVFTVTQTGQPVRAQGVLTVTPDYGLHDAPPSEVLAFFGGHVDAAAADPALQAWIARRRAATRCFFSVCTGAFILGQAGLLDGRAVTTFHARLDDLAAAVPTADVQRNVRVVDAGPVVSTAGVTAGLDGALYLVSRLSGRAAALRVARYIEYQGEILSGNSL